MRGLAVLRGCGKNEWCRNARGLQKLNHQRLFIPISNFFALAPPSFRASSLFASNAHIGGGFELREQKLLAQRGTRGGKQGKSRRFPVSEQGKRGGGRGKTPRFQVSEVPSFPAKDPFRLPAGSRAVGRRGARARQRGVVGPNRAGPGRAERCSALHTARARPLGVAWPSWP